MRKTIEVCRPCVEAMRRAGKVLPLTWRPDFLFKERNGKKGASPLMDVMWCVWLTPQMQGVQTVFKPLMRPEMETNNGTTD